MKSAAKGGAKTAPVKKPAAGASKAGTGNKKTPQATPKQKTEEPKKAVKKWTPEDEAARKIQTMARGFLARKRLQTEKEKKKAYEEEMDRLEKEAFVYLVKLEQEQAEKEYLKEQEERKRRQTELKRRKRFLDAAFEGEFDEMTAVLKEIKQLDDDSGIGTDDIGQTIRERHQLSVVECEDPNGNTPLSEASSGGHVEVITFLIERGANPNSKGQFDRTPLYRASYAGHLEACQTLLQYGADPRIYAGDGQTPEHIASQDAVKELLASWDTQETDKLLKKLDAEKERRKAAERKRQENETQKQEDTVQEIEMEYRIMQKKVQKLIEEREKRVTEHDTAASQGFDRPEITLAVIHDAELELEVAKVDLEKLRDKLAEAKLKLREQKAESADDLKGQEKPGLPVLIRELDDVLLRDVGNKIRDSGKWPLIIDPSQQAATFLRYRDTNYLNALSPIGMEPNTIRLALIGAIRFGKPLVIDMMMVDMFDTVGARFDEVQSGLMEMIMNKEVLKEENYMKLVREGDGPEYDKLRFDSGRIANFKLCIITKNVYPSEELLDQTYAIRVHIPVD